jgi:hypothetical protein
LQLQPTTQILVFCCRFAATVLESERKDGSKGAAGVVPAAFFRKARENSAKDRRFSSEAGCGSGAGAV